MSLHDEGDTEWIADPDGDTEVATWDDVHTALSDTSPEPAALGQRVLTSQADSETETEVLSRSGFRPLQLDVDAETTFRDEEPPTVKLAAAPSAVPRIRRLALPVGTSNVPANQAWSASGQDETWPAARLAALDDRTAPSLFPTPEDNAKEQRPFPPPPDPRPRDHDVPIAITSTLLGMGVGFVFMMTLGAVALGWVWLRGGL